MPVLFRMPSQGFIVNNRDASFSSATCTLHPLSLTYSINKISTLVKIPLFISSRTMEKDVAIDWKPFRDQKQPAETNNNMAVIYCVSLNGIRKFCVRAVQMHSVLEGKILYNHSIMMLYNHFIMMLNLIIVHFMCKSGPKSRQTGH